MSAVRRSSLQDSRDKLGEPYQIYTEVVNAGKTVQGKIDFNIQQMSSSAPLYFVGIVLRHQKEGQMALWFF